MCTVSIIPFVTSGNHAGAPFPNVGSAGISGAARAIGFRLVTNRDELRTRPPAVDPKWHDFIPASPGDLPVSPQAVRAIYPLDPAGGGTWIGGSTTGLVLCLLNGNPIPAPHLPPKDQLESRGVIIPRLFSLAGASHSLTDVLERLETFDLNRFAPFRLVAVRPSRDSGQQGFVAVEASWDRAEFIVREHPPGPACFVSSGLGDPLVKPRIALFNRMVRAAKSPLAELPSEQDRFHRHTWADRTEISVMMLRKDARTVSITSVEVVPSADAAGSKGAGAEFDLSLEYEPVADRSAGMAASDSAPGTRRDEASAASPATVHKYKVTVPARVARQAQ